MNEFMKFMFEGKRWSHKYNQCIIKKEKRKGKPKLKDKGHMKLVRPTAEAQGHKGSLLTHYQNLQGIIPQLLSTKPTMTVTGQAT